MNREYAIFTCAVICAIAMPFVVRALSRKLSATLDGERQARAVLYLGLDVLLAVMIFCFWLME